MFGNEAIPFRVACIAATVFFPIVSGEASFVFRIVEAPVTAIESVGVRGRRTAADRGVTSKKGS
jgi:hypothetical protein